MFYFLKKIFIQKLDTIRRTLKLDSTIFEVVLYCLKLITLVCFITTKWRMLNIYKLDIIYYGF